MKKGMRTLARSSSEEQKSLRGRNEQVHCRRLRRRCAISLIWMHCDENRTCLHITIFFRKSQLRFAY